MLMTHLQEVTNYLVGSVSYLVLVLIVLLIPSVLLSMIYKIRRGGSLFSTLRSTYPRFGILSIFFGPQLYILTEDALYDHYVPDTYYMFSAIFSICVIISVIIIWRQYKQKSGIEETHTVRKVMLSSVGLATLIVLFSFFCYAFLFYPDAGPSIACDMGVMWDEEECKVSSYSLQFSEIYNTDSSTYNITVLRPHEGVYEYYSIYAVNETSVETIDSAGEEVKITNVEQGEKIKLAGRTEDGIRRFFGYYTVAG